jgi:vacuolar-type H+-ATPase subunit E/Vma4
MGESELKIALQREGEAQTRDLWKQAEDVVAKRRAELEAERLRIHAEADRQLQEATSLLRNNLLLDAQTRALESRLHVEAALEERLLNLARQLLPELAKDNRSALWKALSAELPKTGWTSLTVHPADRELAERDFAAARIDCDATIGGGLIAASADGMIRVDNSLACRLMRAWPDLLPKLLSELRKRVDNDETAGTDTTD